MNALAWAAWGVFVAVPLYCYYRHVRLHFAQWDRAWVELDAAHRRAYEAEDLDEHDRLSRVEERMFRYFNGRHEE